MCHQLAGFTIKSNYQLCLTQPGQGERVGGVFTVGEDNGFAGGGGCW